MPRVLDTNVLLKKWAHDGLFRRTVKEAVIRESARELINLYDSDLIITPVEIELLAGTRNQDELRRMRIFVGEFRLADGGRITQDDWEKAKQIAQRVPADARQSGYRRQLCDCLFRAVCARLNFDPFTFDKFERTWPN